ncbi:NAD(P)/FAD-dependent oxidoreductase [Halorubrum lacusprofundi]|jgi:glycine/D-amino acid oxidase-like deaminating enzyme|uniref:FAD dependent oxidoreductase n=1 Tax=Halorubrum lacusprofundi (strain ATCC 49239 / DSM 5036 / JCM 8891 / ACAM 34) TaxID=416348 RepID=B9LTV4_HALLT|nr:FAD-dependent oxidoreductase [Halorubrum lacusprofundi]ACM56238.1 FAD dependent oxidoreductase [Halorubrum lacusprofundi ATCC 49239]
MSRPDAPADRDALTPAVAVVGGGAVGVTAAADLAARGAEVTLYDRSDLGAGSSGRAAGVLYDAYAEDVDAALAARAMERFRAFDRSLPEFTFTPCPYVIAVREGDPDAEAVPAMVDRMRAHDRAVSLVDLETLGEQFPVTTDDLAVAAVAEGAGWCDPASYVAAMGERARREGVAVETHTPVSLAGDGPELRVGGSRAVDGETVDDEGADRSVETRSFDALVVATGAHTAGFLGGARIEVPVVPYRVQALTAGLGGSGSASYDGPMVYDATAGVYVRPHPTGLLAGDGTEPVPADPDDYDRTGDDWFVESVSATLRERLDAVGEDRAVGADGPAVECAWAGLCTATPDGDPLVGAVGDPADRVFVAAGWQGHGFMRAPAIGELVAEGVLASLGGIEAEDPDSPWIDAFDPDRFDGNEEFDIAEGMSVESRVEE